jgi:hypothetical protein
MHRGATRVTEIAKDFEKTSESHIVQAFTIEIIWDQRKNFLRGYILASGSTGAVAFISKKSFDIA